MRRTATMMMTEYRDFLNIRFRSFYVHYSSTVGVMALKEPFWFIAKNKKDLLYPDQTSQWFSNKEELTPYTDTVLLNLLIK